MSLDEGAQLIASIGNFIIVATIRFRVTADGRGGRFGQVSNLCGACRL